MRLRFTRNLPVILLTLTSSLIYDQLGGDYTRLYTKALCRLEMNLYEGQHADRTCQAGQTSLRRIPTRSTQIHRFKVGG